jgi:hypothetical protein
VPQLAQLVPSLPYHHHGSGPVANEVLLRHPPTACCELPHPAIGAQGRLDERLYLLFRLGSGSIGDVLGTDPTQEVAKEDYFAGSVVTISSELEKVYYTNPVC